MRDVGKIFNIQRFSTSDGPGIRTVVFLKGCPLNCAWCHNPESKSVEHELFYEQDTCISCGICAQHCHNDCHILVKGRHMLDRQNCDKCMTCVAFCPTGALKRCGEEKSTQQMIDTVLRDRPFYEESGGGLTISGGEPLLQYDFALSLLKLAKANGLHTAIETCGYTSRDLTSLKMYTDLWLYDIKLFSEQEHIKYTGVSNRKIWDSLLSLDRMGAKIILRCPIIPGVNFSEQHFQQIADLTNQLTNILGIHLEAYHPLGHAKAQRMGKTQAYQNDHFLDKKMLQDRAAALAAATNKEVTIL